MKVQAESQSQQWLHCITASNDQSQHKEIQVVLLDAIIDRKLFC